MMEPIDVMDQGRMAFFFDPTGAAFGVWQPKEHTGADVVSEPGSVAWNQVNTRDPEKASEFYKAVFGWDSERVDTGGANYWELQLDGSSVGGMFEMGDDFPRRGARPLDRLLRGRGHRRGHRAGQEWRRTGPRRAV